jgi:hypothetical protein
VRRVERTKNEDQRMRTGEERATQKSRGASATKSSFQWCRKIGKQQMTYLHQYLSVSNRTANTTLYKHSTIIPSSGNGEPNPYWYFLLRFCRPTNFTLVNHYMAGCSSLLTRQCYMVRSAIISTIIRGKGGVVDGSGRGSKKIKTKKKKKKKKGKQRRKGSCCCRCCCRYCRRRCCCCCSVNRVAACLSVIRLALSLRRSKGVS